MKQPTLEEVKEYFKNAKTIECLDDKDEYILDLNQDFTFKKTCIWLLNQEDKPFSGSNTSCMIWSLESGFAKILTYKEKTFSITESQIKDLCHSSLYSNTERLKKMFPEAFESEVKELKIGTWYKSKLTPTTIINCQIFTENEKGGYGLHMNHWSENWGLLNFQDYVEATEQEVFEALRAGSLKRYKAGQLFYLDQTHKEIGYLKMDEDGFKYYPKDNQFFVGAQKNRRAEVFYKGIWREEIESITLSEAEQQLGKKIIV
jgi:hypothetical protein